MNRLVLKTFLMVVANGKAYTSGLQASAVTSLIESGVVYRESDAFGDFIRLSALGLERAIGMLAREDNPKPYNPCAPYRCGEPGLGRN